MEDYKPRRENRGSRDRGSRPGGFRSARSFGGRGGGSRDGGFRGRSFSGRDEGERSDRRSGGFSRGPRRDEGFSRGPRRAFGAREERRPLEKYEVTCDKCGKKTDVPFKPTQGKPVYCRECFDAGKPVDVSAEQINKINEKLDKIMASLGLK